MKAIRSIKYYDELIILLEQGFVSEFCGLTDRDIDFRESDNHRIISFNIPGKSPTGIETPKTDNGIRKIQWADRVLEALQRVMQNRKEHFMVDLPYRLPFLTRNGTPQNPLTMILRFAGWWKVQQKPWGSLPAWVTTPHTLRHTFSCTNMANAEWIRLAVSYGTRQHNDDPELRTSHLTAHRRNFSGWRLKEKEMF